MTIKQRRNSTQQALPVFVLTLPDADERRRDLVTALVALDLEYELFFGVDGRKGLPAQYEHEVDRSARVNKIRRPMTDGEFACALSHIRIAKEIVERGIEQALVLEDDAIIGSYVAAIARGKIPVVGDLMLLDHAKGFFRRTGQISVTPQLTAYRVAAAPDLATGYVISQSMAAQLLQYALPVRQVADWPSVIEKVRTYAIYPRIVGHPDPQKGASELRSERDSINRAFADNKSPKPSKARRLISRAYWERKLRKKLYHQLVL